MGPNNKDDDKNDEKSEPTNPDYESDREWDNSANSDYGQHTPVNSDR